MPNSAQWVLETGPSRRRPFLYGSFAHPGFHLVNQGLLSPKGESDPVLGTENTLGNKTNSLPIPEEGMGIKPILSGMKEQC